MTALKTVLDKEVDRLVAELKQSAIDKDYNVTGQTIAAFRGEATETRLTLYGASYLNSLEFGRPPLQGSAEESDFLAKLEVWRQIRGVQISAKSLRYLINRFGTRLFQGKDPRFNGKQSGVITDVINDKTIEKIVKAIEVAFGEQVANQIKEIFPQKRK